MSKLMGRPCPAQCTSHNQCVGGKKCLCDGLCGKTCANPSKTLEMLIEPTYVFVFYVNLYCFWEFVFDFLLPVDKIRNGYVRNYRTIEDK